MPKEITVTYNAQITEVLKSSELGASEEFFRNEYPEIIGERLKNKMGFDDVKIGEFKVFVRTEDKD